MGEMEREELGALLSAYVDGEATPEEAELVERVVAKDEGARRLLEEFRQMAHLVSSLPVHPAPSSIADDLQLQTERSELLGDPDESRVVRGRRRPSILAWTSMAAMLGFALVCGWIFIANLDARRGASSQFASTRTPKDAAPVQPDGGPALETEESTRASRATPTGQLGERIAMRPVDRTERLKGRSESAPSALRTDMATDYVAAKTETVDAPSSAPDVGASAKSLIASANLDRKLAARLPLISLRTHRFENEPIRLRVSVATAADREAVMNRLASRLRRDRAVDLTDRPLILPGGGAAVGGFHYRGQAGTNFDEQDQRQLLVRLPVSKVDGLLVALGRAAGVAGDVTLLVESFPVRGLADARRMLQQGYARHEAVGDATGVTSPEGAMETARHEPGPIESTDASTLLSLAEEMFGVDLGRYAAAPGPMLNGPPDEEGGLQQVRVALAAPPGAPPVEPGAEPEAESDRTEADAAERVGPAGRPGRPETRRAAGARRLDGGPKSERSTTAKRRSMARGGKSQAVTMTEEFKKKRAAEQDREEPPSAADATPEKQAPGAVVPDEPPTLVQRRLRALRRRPAGAIVPGAVGAAPSKNKQASIGPAERLITLVVEVLIAEPGTAGPAHARPAQRTNPADKPSPKEPPTDPVQQ